MSEQQNRHNFYPSLRLSELEPASDFNPDANQRVHGFVMKMKEQIKYELDLCFQDQQNLNQNLNGIDEFERAQLT